MSALEVQLRLKRRRLEEKVKGATTDAQDIERMLNNAGHISPSEGEKEQQEEEQEEEQQQEQQEDQEHKEQEDEQQENEEIDGKDEVPPPPAEQQARGEWVQRVEQCEWTMDASNQGLVHRGRSLGERNLREKLDSLVRDGYVDVVSNGITQTLGEFPSIADALVSAKAVLGTLYFLLTFCLYFW
jgi:hypothetical protein